MISTSKVILYIHCFYLLILQNYLFQMDTIINIYLLLILLILMMSLI